MAYDLRTSAIPAISNADTINKPNVLPEFGAPDTIEALRDRLQDLWDQTAVLIAQARSTEVRYPERFLWETLEALNLFDMSHGISLPSNPAVGKLHGDYSQPDIPLRPLVWDGQDWVSYLEDIQPGGSMLDVILAPFLVNQQVVNAGNQALVDELETSLLGGATNAGDTLGKLEALIDALDAALAGKRDSGPIAASDINGVLDPAQIPPSVLATPIVALDADDEACAIADIKASLQDQIGQGSPVIVADGRVLYYKGTGSKTSEASYVVGADQTPAVEQIPALPISKTTGLQDALDAKQPAFSDVRPLGARTSNPSERNDGSALQVGDEWYRSDLDAVFRHYGDGARQIGFTDTKELTNFVPESVRSAVFGGSADAVPYLDAAETQLGDGGRLILPAGTMDVRSQKQFTSNGFCVQGAGRASVLRQNYTGGHPFVIGRTDAGSAMTQDITFTGLLLSRTAGDHAFFETTKLRTLVLDDVEFSQLYALAVLGRAGLGASTYQLWMEDLDGAMAAAGHGTGILGVNCAGGVYSARVFTEARHDISFQPWIDFTPNSANQSRADGISIHGGNVKGWRNAVRAIDSRIVNIEGYGARFDEMGEAAFCFEATETPADVNRVGFEGLMLAGCVNGAGNIANKGMLRIRNNANGSSFVGVTMAGCQFNRVTGPAVDIETHASNGAAVNQLIMTGNAAKDVSMPDELQSLVRLKNNVRNVGIVGLSSRSESGNKPLHIVDLDLISSVPAENIYAAGVVGDVAPGGSRIRDPLGKNQAMPTKPQFLAAANTFGVPQTFPEATLDGATGRLMRTIKDAGTLADDAVRSYVIGTGRAGRVFVSANANQYVEALFESIGTVSVTSLREHANASTSTSVLTGTTGADGELTVSFNTDTLYIENRLGGTVRLNIIIEYNEST